MLWKFFVRLLQAATFVSVTKVTDDAIDHVAKVDEGSKVQPWLIGIAKLVAGVCIGNFVTGAVGGFAEECKGLLPGKKS